MFLLLLNSTAIYAQPVAQYNINRYNGLPGNHAYYLLKDKLNYLWIATEKGVVKYNGYTFKTFDLSSGIANSDIWKLFEDPQGKIWLFSISNEIGYIANNKYKKLYDEDKLKAYYPRYITSSGNSMMILNHPKAGNSMYVSFVRNDTIRNYPAKHIPPNTAGTFLYKNRLLTLHNNSIYALDPLGYSALKKICSAEFLKTEFYGRQNFLESHYILSYSYLDNIIYIIDVDNCNIKKVELEKQAVLVNSFRERDTFFIIAKNKVYQFDPSFNLKKITALKVPSKDEAQVNLTHFINEDFWGRVWSTSTNGLYIEYTTEHFKRSTLNFTDYKYVGSSTDSIHYWWNDNYRKLAAVSNGNVQFREYNNLGDIFSIMPYDKTRALVLARLGTYLLNTRTGTLSDLFAPVSHYHMDTLITPKYVLANVIRAVAYDTSDFYMVLRGSVFQHIWQRNDTVYAVRSGIDLLMDMIYDKEHHLLLLYNNNKVILHHLDNNRKTFITKEQFATTGIQRIDKILLDSFGNIYIKDNNTLWLYNYKLNIIKQLFADVRFIEPYIDIQNNTIVAAGKFGILFSRINGPAKLSAPVIYHNLKNINYSYISGMQVTNKDVWLNTDAGLYEISMPSDTVWNTTNTYEYPHKFILTYNDSERNIQNSDTIIINQKNSDLLLDVINPHGIGTLKFAYKLLDSQWQELNSNELHLPHLKPGKYYTLSLTASDEVWKSKVLHLRIYIIPYWWQTNEGMAILGILGVSLVVIIALGIITVTKRIVSRNHIKKNRLLSLELKAIYAQINPHFIFNTLNTGLYFIQEKKTEEAYEHIASFSELLWSYLKSSRNKYISLAQETENLGKYITLQQTRFEDKFDFEIITDKDIDPENTDIPALLLQPLVENAIIHGLLNKEGHGHLRIAFRKEGDNTLICEIEDDGIGREQAMKLNKENREIKSESFGSDLIKDLVSIFNTYENINIDIQYIDKVFPQTGTIVKLIIKKKDND